MPTVNNAGADLYYEVHGEGPALVFAHGRGGNAASWWQQVPRFAQNYQVIVFDHRSFGRSRCAEADFDRSHFPADLVAILDDLRIKKASIVCQSMGGWTGLGTAIEYPERVQALVLSNTPAGIDTPEVRASIENSQQQFIKHGVGSAALAPDFAQRCPEAAFLYAQISGFNVNFPFNVISNSSAGRSLAQLAAVQAPTLFISSEQDQLFHHTLIESLANELTGAQFIKLPIAGHSPYFETPQAFNEVVLEFLSKHNAI